MSHGAHPGSATRAHLPRLIAWEVTRSCLLNCKHCRAAAGQGAYSGELTLPECRALLDHIASFSRPTIILTGGEPMLRADIYDIAAYAHGLGLPVVMAPCGPLLNDETVAKILKSGIRRISLSLDGATAASHDEFRGIPGAFESVLRGIEAARRGGLEFQINTTVSRHNLAELPAILDLAIRLRAALEHGNLSYQLTIYADAPHGWLNDTMPGRYRPEIAKQTWSEVVAFLKRTLSGAPPPDTIDWSFTARKHLDYDFTKNVRLE